MLRPTNLALLLIGVALMSPATAGDADEAWHEQSHHWITVALIEGHRDNPSTAQDPDEVCFFAGTSSIDYYPHSPSYHDVGEMYVAITPYTSDLNPCLDYVSQGYFYCNLGPFPGSLECEHSNCNYWVMARHCSASLTMFADQRIIIEHFDDNLDPDLPGGQEIHTYGRLESLF